MGTFEAFYASPMQHPFLLWLAAALAIGFCATRPGLGSSLRRYCLGLGVLSLLDAWLSSSHIIGIGGLSGWLASVVPLFFVLAGDFRYLLLAVSASSEGTIQVSGAKVALALGLTAIVPISSQLMLLLVPDSLDKTRVMFFIYEVEFVVLTLCLLRFHENLRRVAWVRRVSRFVIVYYSLWAGADLLILTTGADLGYLLRVVPNLLYYGGLIGVMGYFASVADASEPA
jgi:hypothetical protein